MNKRLIYTVISLLLMWGILPAQDLGLKKGTYGIDHNKKMIVAIGQHQDMAAVDVEGETYRLYRTTMPIININTDGEIVNSPAVHGIISVADANGDVIEMHAGFKIRGTSSQQYDKKSYRVELWADATGTVMADTTFLGLRSDDDWNLEAMWAQPLRLRDKVANELWMEMYQLPYQANEPTAMPGIRMEYADVFINDNYVGVYALTERMDRKQLGLRKYNGNIRGLLFKGNGVGAPTFDTLPEYDNTQDTWANYEWVYPNESDTVIDWSSIYNFTNFVMNSSDMAFYMTYNSQFDVDNAIDYYLFINTVMAMDNMGRNLFVARYKKSGAFFYLPWDLDAILGLDTEGAHSDNAVGLLGNGFYDRLLNDCNGGGFVDMAQARYNALREDILTRDHIMEMVRNQYDELVSMGVYEREHEAWPDFTVDETQLDYMSQWLEARFAYLDVELNSGCGTWNMEEDPESQFVEVFPNPAKDRINVRFAEDCEAVIILYDMTGRGVYSSNISTQAFSISTHSLHSGIYTLVVISGGKQEVKRVAVE